MFNVNQILNVHHHQMPYALLLIPAFLAGLIKIVVFKLGYLIVIVESVSNVLIILNAQHPQLPSAYQRMYALLV